MLKNVFLEYCNESTIHGVRYLTDSRKTYLERFSWLLFLIFSIACCCWFTYNLYISAQSSSIVMTISVRTQNRPTRISDIRFPSLTICPTFPFNISVLNITKELEMFENQSFNENYTIDEMRTLFAQYCLVKDMREPPLQQFDYVKTLLKTNLRLNNGGRAQCAIGYKRSKCPHQFQEIVTNVGICYTYNTLSTRSIYRSLNGTTFDFSTDLMQIVNASDEVVNFDGPYERGRTALQIVIDADHLKESCSPNTEGFVVAIRSRGDAVVITSADVRVKEDYSTDLVLSPSALEASEDLKAFSVEERECYFGEERVLRFLRYYTQENCHHECLTNLTLNRCGCVQYYMPRLKATLVCFGDILINCANDVEQNYDNMGTGPCSCYPACNSVSFNVNVASHKINMESYMPAGFLRNLIYTTLFIFTKEKNVYPLYRSQLYTFNDYVANFGGVLGLFLGISILSIIELFYYVLVRPLTLLLKRQQINEVSAVTLPTADDHVIYDTFQNNYAAEFGHVPERNFLKRLG